VRLRKPKVIQEFELDTGAKQAHVAGE